MLPSFMLQQALTIERYQGDTPNGPAYEPARPYPCYVEEDSRLVAIGEGNTRHYATVAYLQPNLDDIPVESRATFRGRVMRVTKAARFEASLGTPDHIELEMT